MGAYVIVNNLSLESMWTFGEMRSDNTTFQYNTDYQSDVTRWEIDWFTENSMNSIINSAWNLCYVGIGRCNTIIHYIDDEEFDNKAQYLAEAKFLRAFYYFHLVKYFGNIPLVTQKIESRDEAFKLNKQVPSDLVFNQIITDLNEAKNDLPKVYSAKNVGRATEGVARTLLAKVLMWNSRYEDAAKELEAIIQSNQYLLLDDYSLVFDIENQNNPEIIFSSQFIEGASYGLYSNFMYQFSPWNIGEAAVTKYGYPFPGVSEWFFGRNIPTPSLLRSFEYGDTRKNMIDTTFIDYQRPVYNDSIVPFTLKFLDLKHTRVRETSANFPIYRYPHVLLSLAECYLRIGGGDPLPLVNQIRIRAGLPKLLNVSLDDIIHERRVEFHCECDRWDVLLRTGLAQKVMEAHGIEQRKRSITPEKAYTSIKLLFPIPSTQIELDSTLEQNPDYK